MRGRDLLSIADLSPDELSNLLDTARGLKEGDDRGLLTRKTLALL